MEYFKKIEGLDKYYVNRDGEIHSFKYIKPRILKPTINHKGYYLVSLNKGSRGRRVTKSIHRIVASSFISNSENKTQINHKNGIKIDNRVENLEWCSCKENINHAYKTGLMANYDRRGEKNKQSKLNNVKILEIRALIKAKYSYRAIAKIYNVHNSLIGLIAKNKIWKHI